MNSIELFFSALSQRMCGKENNLSDITWAMCQASDAFRRAFLLFFFPNLDPNNVEDISREVTEGASRVDFYIRCKDETVYLVEVKIWNRNQHFGRYEADFNVPSERLGYIVNYELQQELYTIHTWEEFYDYLGPLIPAGEESLWNGYREYVKGVCCFIKLTHPIHSTDEDFRENMIYLIGRVIESIQNEAFKCSVYSGRTSGLIWGDNSGHYFQVDYPNGESSTIWGAFAVWNADGDITINICLKNVEGWGAPFCTRFDSDEKLEKIKLTNATWYIAPPLWWFDLDVEKFNACATIREQIEMLRTFFIEVVSAPLLAKEKD